MTNRIDIQVEDKGISPEVKAKLGAIADTADRGHVAVERLRSALKSLDAQSFVQLAKAYSQLNSETQKANLNYIKQEEALSRAVAAEAKAQLAVAKHTAELEKQTAAAIKASSAQDKLAKSIAEARAKQFATNAQSDFNSILGVNKPVSKSARGSADAFKELLDAKEKTEALAKAQTNQTAAAAKAAAMMAAVGSQTKLTKMQMLTLQYTVNDVAASLASGASPFTILLQQGGQVTQAFGGIRGTFATLLSSLGPVGIAFGVIAAAVAVVVGVTYSANEEIRELNRTLDSTNGYTGLTASSFLTMADQIAQAANISRREARSISSELAATGQFQAEQIEQTGVSIVRLSRMTDQSVSTVTANFKKMADGPTAFAETFNKQFHLLSVAQMDYIRNLEDTGQKSRAFATLSQNIYDELGKKAPQQLGYLERAWHSVANAISNAWTTLKDFGREQTKAEQIADLQNRLNLKIQQGPTNEMPAVVAAWEKGKKALEDQLALLRGQQKAESDAAKLAADAAKAQQDGADASKRLSDNWLNFGDNARKANQEIESFRRDIEAALKADPTNQSALDAKNRQKQIEGEIRKRYMPQSFGQEESRTLTLQKLNAEIEKETKYLGMLATEREIQQRLDQIDIDLASKKQRKLSPTERGDLEAKLKDQQNAKLQQAAQDRIYEEANGPLREYSANLAAAAILRAKGAITAEQEQQAVNKAKIAYQQVVDPLAEMNRSMDQQAELLGKVGDARIVAQQMQQAENELRQKGLSLYDAETGALTSQGIQLQDKLNKLQQLTRGAEAYNEIWQQTIGQQQQITDQIYATNKTFDDGLISIDNYTAQMTQLGVAALDLKLKTEQASNTDALTRGMATLVEGYQGVLPGLSKAYGDFFSQLEDGAANSIGRAIVYGDNLSESLQNVAKQAVASLIGALIKLGIQYVINATIGESVATAATAAGAALASATASAWAPAAAMASLASFGANSAPAMAGITATTALAETLAAVGGAGFKKGGYTGNYGVSEVAGVVHGREFVVNADATAKHRSLLEAMNDGTFNTSSSRNSPMVQSMANGDSVVSNGSNVYVGVKIYNNASGVGVTHKERQGPNGPELELFIERTVVNNIRDGGRIAETIENQYGSNRAIGARG